MTGYLLEALAIPRRPLRGGTLAQLPRIAAAVAALEVMFGDGGNYQPPPQPDLLALWKRLDAADRSECYSRLSNREWRDSPWCFWLAHGKAELLVQRASFLRSYSNWLKARRRKGDYRRLVQAWLLNFDRESPPILTAKLIVEACIRWPEWTWAQRHTAIALFDVKRGPANLASHALEQPLPVNDVLRANGLGEWLQTGGYAEAAFATLLLDLPRRLQGNTDETGALHLLQRTLEWGTNSPEKPQFPRLLSATAEALLLPWTGKPPAKALERTITIFLLRYLNDPRMYPTRWNDVSEAAKNVFKRWLMGATLEAFVDIIKRVAESGHWKYREAFWMSYYRAGHVTDAWIAMGPEGESLAGRTSDLRGQFAKLGGQRALNHCVLLLRVGDLTVADWSHTGKCRIWKQRTKGRPDLYKSRYDGDALRASADLEVVHQGSDSGRWQGQIHRYIRSITGIGISAQKYMP